MNVVQEVEKDVLSIIVNRRHDEIGGPHQISKLVELILIKFINVSISKLLVVLLSSENEHPVEVKRDDPHSILPDVNFRVTQDIFEIEHGPT